LAGDFFTALAGAAFLATAFLAGAVFFGVTYASFSVNSRCLCNNKSPCQAKSSTRATSRGCSSSVPLFSDTAESRSLEAGISAQLERSGLTLLEL
jgi:hypothetical protein